MFQNNIFRFFRRKKIDEIINIDAIRREITRKVETMKAEQNSASKEIPKIKKSGGDISTA